MGSNRLVFSAPQYYGIFNDPLTHESAGYISGISNSNYIHSTITTHDWMNYPALPFAIASGVVELETIDSGLGDSNTYDSFELTIIPNSVEAPSLYSTFGENELITGELYLAEITIQRSER